MEEIKKSPCVDDVITWGETTEEVHKLKESAFTVIGEAQFEWHSNEPETGNKAMPKNNLESNLEKPRCWATMERNRRHHRRHIPKGLPKSI